LTSAKHQRCDRKFKYQATAMADSQDDLSTSAEECSPVNQNCILMRTAQRLEEFYRKGLMCDVCLITGHKRIQAHRVVLAAASDYFHALFTTNMKESLSDEVHIGSIDPDILEAIITYCYSGVIEVNEMNVENLFQGASMLQVPSVVDRCSELLIEKLHPSNCIGIRSFADRNGCDVLMDAAEKFVYQNFVEVIKHDEYLLLNVAEVIELLSSDFLNVPNEGIIYEALMLWIMHSKEERVEYLERLFDVLRIAVLPPKYIVEQIKTNPLIMNSLVCCKQIVDALEFHLCPSARSMFELGIRCRARKSTLGSVICFGGTDATKKALISEQYDFVNDRWNPVVYASKRVQFGVALFGDRVFFVGGREGLKTLSVVDVWDYKRDKNVCLTRIPSMNTPRHALGVAVMDDMIFAIGGHDGWTCLSSAERFDGKEWVKIADMSTARSSFGIAVLNGKIYAVGGRGAGNCHSSVECYHPLRNCWYPCADMSHPRGNVAVGVLNGFLYAVGGVSSVISKLAVRYTAVERYNPETDEWIYVAHLSSARDGIAICTVGCFLLAIGGYSDKQYENCVEYYDEISCRWHKIAPLKYARAGASALVFPNVTVYP
ncbi:Kelch-like protein 5, partial [Trichinella britovi]